MVQEVIEDVVDVPILVEWVHNFTDGIGAYRDRTICIGGWLCVGRRQPSIAFVPTAVIERKTGESSLAKKGCVCRTQVRFGARPTVTKKNCRVAAIGACAIWNEQVRRETRALAPNGNLFLHGLSPQSTQGAYCRLRSGRSRSG